MQGPGSERAGGTATARRARSAGPAIGDVLFGKYRVVRVLGAGSMGKVLAAEHVVLGTRVALKIMRPELIDSPVALKRFDLEMRTTARLRSDHIVRLYDVESLPSGVPVIVMEQLDGYSLERLVFARALASATRATTWAMHACRALAEAHAMGVIHRDIKPENLFLTVNRSGEEVVKVLDFGLAKCRDDSGGSRATAAATTVGSPQYMSPEQVRGDDLDARADLWSLGATIYELLTGRTPFQDRDMRGLFEKILYTRPLPLEQLRPDLPPALVAVVMRCLQPDPAHRWPSARDLEAALARCLVPASAMVRPSSPPPVPSMRADHARAPQTQRAPRRPEPWAAILLGAACGVVAFAALGAGFAFFLHTRPQASAATAQAAPAPSSAADQSVKQPAWFAAGPSAP